MFVRGYWRRYGLTPVGFRMISTSRQISMRGSGDSGNREYRKDAKTILEEEKNGIFRILDVGKPRDDNGNMRPRRDPRGPQANDRRGPPRHTQMKPSQDWNSVWPAARTFHPAVVPLPVRQGAIQIKNQVIPSKYANTELMKIPNFLHLTPPVIKKHCDALRKFCTPFPPALDSEYKIQNNFPVQVETSDYLNSDSSIRDRRSRRIVLKFKLSSLEFDDHARDKIIRLLGHRYDVDSDVVSLTCDRCPYRGQNLDYARYLVTALYFESYRVDAWEHKEHDDYAVYSANTESADSGSGEFVSSLEDVLNAGENEETLRMYKEAARKLLKLPAQNVSAETV